MNAMKYILTVAGFADMAISKCKAASILVDTFEQGGFHLNNLDSVQHDVNLPLSNRRVIRNKGCPLPGASMESGLDTSASQVTLFVSGAAAGNSPGCPLGMNIVYNDVVMHDITDYTGFMLGFTNMSGIGSIYVEVGGQDLKAHVNRINLTGAGDFFYPLDRVYENVGFSKDSFNILIFTFEATSPEFSFTLDQIRLVPETSSSALLGASLLLLGCRRTRKPRNS